MSTLEHDADFLAELAEHDTVHVAGLGTWTRRTLPRRPGRDPRTGALFDVDAAVKIDFEIAATLREWLADPTGPVPEIDRIGGALRAGVDACLAAIAAGGPAPLAELGWFRVRVFEPRVGRDRQTGAPVAIAGRRHLSFTASTWALACMEDRALLPPHMTPTQRSILDCAREPMDDEALLARLIAGGLEARTDGEAWIARLEERLGRRLPAPIRAIWRALRLEDGPWQTPLFFRDGGEAREASARFERSMSELPQDLTLVPIAKEPHEGYWATALEPADDPAIYSVDDDGTVSPEPLTTRRWLTALALWAEMKEALGGGHASVALSVAVERRLRELAPDAGLDGFFPV